MLRAKYHPIIWTALWPMRAYVKQFPYQRGKGLIVRRIVAPLLPPRPASYVYSLPGGGRVQLQYRENIGLGTLMSQEYETAEILALKSHARAGTTAIDVGANVGLFTVALAQAVGGNGKVLALEPLASNVDRLRANLLLNRLQNVEIQQVAAGASAGRITMHIADDPAYHSTGVVAAGRDTGEETDVQMQTLDQIWMENGLPCVSVVKIDVEGEEMAVLAGSHRLLDTLHPVLMLEAKGQASVGAVETFLAPFGYSRILPDGFEARNLLFVPSGEAKHDLS